jgi:hypothetical protein
MRCSNRGRTCSIRHGIGCDHDPKPAIHRLQRRGEDADIGFDSTQHQHAAAEAIKGGREGGTGIGGEPIFVDLRLRGRLGGQRRHEIEEIG